MPQVRRAEIAIDYATSFLRDVFDEKLRTWGYEDFPFEAVAIDLFQYLMAREFVISRQTQEPL